MIMSNDVLNKMIKECKTSSDLRKLQIECTNELYGTITDKQAMKILKAQQKLEEKEKGLKRKC